MSARSVLVIFAALSAGCEGVLPGIDWQQMDPQYKFLPYSASGFFADERAMRPPPLFTVPHDSVVNAPALTEGRSDGAYLTSLPVPLTPTLLATGHVSFDTYCAACHGLGGDGESAVSSNMELRRPPSLITADVRAFPPGRIFEVATKGYGFMPSYQHQLTDEQRWAVVAYLQALQLSREVPLTALPEPVRAAAVRALSNQPAKGEGSQ